MKTINLKDFYSSIYTHDCLYEVPDEVAELLMTFKRREEAQRRATYRNKAYYSLDRGDGIEHESIFRVPSAEISFFRYCDRAELFSALLTLTDRQLRRLYAHFFLGMSYTEIAKKENVDRSAVWRSIKRGLRELKNFLKKF